MPSDQDQEPDPPVDAETGDLPPNSGSGTRVAPKLRSGVPDRIAGFRIRRAIASGGMGTVFEAIQEHPRRPVAVKVMKQGITSRSALRRFEYESQILARLRHPGIAQVYEAGMHDDGTGGVPYFAMEYIAGAKSIIEYGTAKDLGTRERLELFRKVCEAVHHGHQKGIIHRDLKPGNILVDSSGQPKIIDFGVARATDSDMAVTTLQTEVGQLVGTVQYMSPEQIEADPHDIDTRSDVYALGVVLYELLTDNLPYDVSVAPVFEATRIIHDESPRRLSGLNKALKGDVETIVLHALQKDRERRYQSALDLSQDIRRYLENRPIHARPPSIAYHFARFVRRNKAIVAGIAAVFVALVLGIVGTSTGLAMARKQAKTATTVTGYFQHMFESIDPWKGSGPDTLVADMLDDAAHDLDEQLAGQPEVQATLHWSLGNAYKALTLWDKAEVELLTALSIREELYRPPSAELADSLHDLAAVLWFKRRYDDALPLYQRSLEMYLQLFDEDTEAVANAANHLAACLASLREYQEAEVLYRQAMRTRELVGGPNSADVAATKQNLATLLRVQGRLEEAELLLRDAVRIVKLVHGPDHMTVAVSYSNLARCLKDLDRITEAEKLYRDALAIKRRRLRADHDSIAITLLHLAALLNEMEPNAERLREAEQHCLEVRRIREGKIEVMNRNWVQPTVLLAEILRKQRRYGEAETLLKEQFDALIAAAQLDPSIQSSRSALWIIDGLIDLYEAMGKPEVAAQLREQRDAITATPPST